MLLCFFVVAQFKCYNNQYIEINVYTISTQKFYLNINNSIKEL